MPYPVAHGLMGAAVVALLGESGPPARRAAGIAAGAFIGILPDFDFALNYLAPRSDRMGWHHGFTHSFVFAIVVGVLTSLALGYRSVRMMAVFSLAIGSHTILDFLFTESRGVALFWPFTEERYLMGTTGSLYQGLRSGERGTRLGSPIAKRLVALVIEAMVVLPMLLAALLWRKWLARTGRVERQSREGGR